MKGADEKKMSKRKVLEALVLVIFCCIPLFLITGCGSDSCIRCTACGDDDNRLLIYASGSNSSGVQYQSCVGPTGILGIGIDSKFWPTECVKVKITDDSMITNGCVVFYNEAGCISNNGVKSSGTYKINSSCIACAFTGGVYTEEVAETTKAFSQTTCFGMYCGKGSPTAPINLNNKMPRSFADGCWTNG